MHYCFFNTMLTVGSAVGYQYCVPLAAIVLVVPLTVTDMAFNDTILTVYGTPEGIFAQAFSVVSVTILNVLLYTVSLAEFVTVIVKLSNAVGSVLLNNNTQLRHCPFAFA